MAELPRGTLSTKVRNLENFSRNLSAEYFPQYEGLCRRAALPMITAQEENVAVISIYAHKYQFVGGKPGLINGLYQFDSVSTISTGPKIWQPRFADLADLEKMLTTPYGQSPRVKEIYEMALAELKHANATRMDLGKAYEWAGDAMRDGAVKRPVMPGAVTSPARDIPAPGGQG